MTTNLKIAFGVIALLAVWIGTLAIVMAFDDSAPAALVLMPTQGFLNNLPEDAAILSQNAISITLAADTPLPHRLYDAGAWLVLPAGLSSCSTV